MRAVRRPITPLRDTPPTTSMPCTTGRRSPVSSRRRPRRARPRPKRAAEWEARLAEAEAAAAENGYYEYDANPYRSVLADDYESAYARRLRGFESPSYNMPSSYINARYSRAFDYVPPTIRPSIT